MGWREIRIVDDEQEKRQAEFRSWTYAIGIGFIVAVLLGIGMALASR